MERGGGDRSARWRAYLETAEPIEWLAAIATLHDDGTADFVEWLARHRRLEVGMAKALYWMLRPGDYVGFASPEAMTPDEFAIWRVLRVIETRYIEEDLAPSTLAFDPAADPHDGYDWTADYRPETAVPGAALPLLGLFLAEAGESVDPVAYAEAHQWTRGAPPTI